MKIMEDLKFVAFIVIMDTALICFGSIFVPFSAKEIVAVFSITVLSAMATILILRLGGQ